MTCLNQDYTKNVMIYLLVACLFQVGDGRAAPDEQTITVEVPETYMGSILGGLASETRLMANNAYSAYSNSADVAAESRKNVMAFFHKINESAMNLGTSTANRMGQLVKNGSRSWSGLLGNLFSTN